MGRKKRDLGARREKESAIYHVTTFFSLVGVVINPLSWIIIGATAAGIGAVFDLFGLPLIVFVVIILVFIIMTLIKEGFVFSDIYYGIHLVYLIAISIVFVMFIFNKLSSDVDAWVLLWPSFTLGIISFVLSIGYSRKIVDESLAFPTFISLMVMIICSLELIAVYFIQ